MNCEHTNQQNNQDQELTVLNLIYEQIEKADNGFIVGYLNSDRYTRDIDIIDCSNTVYSYKASKVIIQNGYIIIEKPGMLSGCDIINTKTGERISDKLNKVVGPNTFIYLSCLDGIIYGALYIDGNMQGPFNKSILVNDQFEIIGLDYIMLKNIRITKKYIYFNTNKTKWGIKDYSIKIDKNTGKVISKKFNIIRTIGNWMATYPNHWRGLPV